MRVNKPLSLHSPYPELFNPDESKQATKPTLDLFRVIQPGWEQTGCKKLTLTLSRVIQPGREQTGCKKLTLALSRVLANSDERNPADLATDARQDFTGLQQLARRVFIDQGAVYIDQAHQ
jgi:hypothetical protein